MLKLTDFLLACKVPLNIHNFKVHLATGKSPTPLEAFFENKFKEWQERQTRKNFPCDMVISLIELRRNKWLFSGVYKILGYEKKSEKHIAYASKLIPRQDDFIGRIIVHHERKGRATYLNGQLDGGKFYISEIRERNLTIKDFQGYNNIFISFSELEIVISQNVQPWKGALSNIKGVYLISDIKTGKLYVGSASGNSGIWQRWSDYVTTGHGGNKDLRKILKTNEPNYKANFHYSILEIADFQSLDDYIL